MLRLSSDFNDKFQNAAKLSHFKVSADLECDDASKSFPTTFQAKAVVNNQVGIHAQVMTEKGNNLEAQFDIFSRIYRDLSFGGEVIYDDKAKTVILSKYGLIWNARKNFSAALEYSQVGDKQTVDASVFHASNPNTSVGSIFSFDTQTKKVEVKTAVSHDVDENVTLKSRINNLGDLDVSVQSKLSPNLTAEFSTGLNLSGIFHGKTHDEAYSGVNLSFKF